jgi:hypothetical protein
MLYRYHIVISTGDILDGLNVGEGRVNSLNNVVWRLRASGAGSLLVCTGRNLPHFSCQNSTSGEVWSTVIDISGGAQFVMDINMGDEKHIL